MSTQPASASEAMDMVHAGLGYQPGPGGLGRAPGRGFRGRQ